MPKPLKPAETRAYLEDNPDKSPTNNYPVIKGTVTVNAAQVTILKEMTALGKEARLSLAFWNNTKDDGTKYLGGKAEAWLSDKDRAEAQRLMADKMIQQSTPTQGQTIEMPQDDIPF